MPLTGQEILPVAQAQAWAALTDREGLKRLCAEGRLTLTRPNPPNSCQIAFHGATDQDKGRAQLRLETLGPARTLLHYTAIGDERVQGLLDELFKAFSAELRARHPVADAAPPELPSSAFQRFLDWYLGWLGKIFTGKL